MSQLKIRLYGDPCLRQKCDTVTDVGSAERMLIQSMIQTMHAHKGIGLAAPQVGINRRILVIDINDGQGPLAMINPTIVKTNRYADMEEGCLSIPNVHIVVERPYEIIVRYTNADNKEEEKRFTELMARAVQHEMDHLDGKLIVDYASDEELDKYRDKLEEIKKQAKNN